MSGSVAGKSNCPTGERFPFLLQLLDGERLRQPEPAKDTSRHKRVNTGVAMLLGRWPGYITAGSIFAAALSMVTVLTIIMITTILIITMLNSNTGHALVTSSESALLNTDTPCDYRHEEQKILNKSRKTSSYETFNSTGVQSSSSPEGKTDNSVTVMPISSHHKVFFVMTDDILSSYHLCAVESAAKFMSNYEFYVIILSTNNTETNIKSDKRFNELLNSYPNIKLFRLKDDKYFHDSPIRSVHLKGDFSPSLIVFAARILTLWRYGGITYDLDLVTLDNNASRGTFPIPSDDSVMISRNGGNVMSVALQCHAFLYHMMMSLASLHANQYARSCDTPVSNDGVIHYALKSFCYKAGQNSETSTVSQENPYKICKGISAMPRSMICRKPEERVSANSNCIWTSSNGRNLHLQQHLCPVSYDQYTSK
jgi:hypothetical protein